MFKKIILKILYKLPPQYISAVRNRFPRLATKTKIFLFESFNWEVKQFKSAVYFDSKSEALEEFKTISSKKLNYQLEIVTPWQPTLTGIGSYSAHILPFLQAHAECGIRISYLEKSHQIDEGIRSFNHISNKTIAQKLPTLYMFGNGTHHWNSFKRMEIDPGVILVHDAKIPDIPVFKGNEKFFWENMSYDDKASSYFGRIPLQTKGLIFHSQHAKDLVFEQLSRKQQLKIKSIVLRTGHPIKVDSSDNLSTVQPLAVGTFGFQNFQKNPELTYLIMSKIAKNTGRRGLIVGEITSDLANLARKIWIQEGNENASLEITGAISDSLYATMLKCVDLGVQLRRHSNGESSGPVSDLLGLGKPCITTRIGSFVELDILKKFSINTKPSFDEFEGIVSKASKLLNSQKLYDNESRNIQDWCSQRTFELAARVIFNFLKESNS
jgi:hypothetical protein